MPSRRNNNVVTPSLLQHCELQRHIHCYNVASGNAAIIATATDLGPFDICWTFVWFSSNFHWTAVQHPFDYRRTFFELSFDVRLTFVELSLNCRLTFVKLSSYVLSFDVWHIFIMCLVVLLSYVMRPTTLTSCVMSSCILPFYRPAFSFDIYLTYIWLLHDVRLTSMRHLLITGHSQRRKPYVVLEFCS